jgi:mono/diheme cytochrome c family protein
MVCSAKPLPWLLVLFFFCTMSSCKADEADLREWRASDHDQPSQASSAQALPPGQSTGKDTGIHGIDEVTIAAWKNNCVRCHGVIGRGDGPQGAMVRAADLTKAEWQASVSDAEIGDVIRKGRGAMPGFKLPDSTVQGLVRLIRLLDAGARLRKAGDAGASDAGGAADKNAARAKANGADGGQR